MKFCGSCGKQLNESAAFCPGCGAKVKTVANETFYMGAQPNSNVGESTTAMLHSVTQAGTNGLKQLGANMTLFIMTACLLIFSFILMFIPIVYESAFFIVRQSENYSLSFLLGESGLGFLMVVGVLLVIIAAIFLFLPLLTNNNYTKRSFILTKIWSIYSLCVGSLMMLIAVIGGAQQIQQLRRQGFEVSIGLTFGGYLFLLINIALIVAVFKLSSKFVRN